MTRLSLINREGKRKQLVEKYRAKREYFKAVIGDRSKGEGEIYAARLQLQRLPRNANPTRQRRRCALTGRPRGNFRKFGLSRCKLREVGMRGEIPGLIKASW